MIPENIKKVDRDQFVTYLDTTPDSASETWKLLGIGITEYSIDFNPQIETEQWIIEKNARNIHESNQKQGSVTQRVYKNDPCFEFVYAGMDKLNYKTHILDIDTWNGTNGSYPAKYSEGLIAVTNYSGEEISYDLYYNGDPIEGTVTIDETTGVPTFVENTSL